MMQALRSFSTNSLRLFRGFLLLAFLMISSCSVEQPVNFDFQKNERNHYPNSYLLCPKNYCYSKVDAMSPVYSCSATKLESTWKKMILLQSRWYLLREDLQHSRYQYVQYSRLFHFPDLIDVIFIPLSSHTSTLAIYSRAKYGYYDFNVNKKRVKSLIAQLNNLI